MKNFSVRFVHDFIMVIAIFKFMCSTFSLRAQRKSSKKKGHLAGAVALRKHHVFGGDEGRPSMGGLMNFGKLLTALIIALNFSVTSAAQVNPVIDDAGLLQTIEVIQLNEKIRAVQQAHKIKIGVVFTKSVGGRDMVTVSNEVLDKNFLNSANGSIVLLVAMDVRKYEMSTNSVMRDKITDYDGIPFLKDKFKSSLNAGDYYGAANNFVDGVDELMTYYETHGKPYVTQAPEGFDPMAACGAVIIALLIGISIRSWLIGSMSNVRHAMEAIDYLKRNTVKFTEKRDTFLFMNVKRRPRSGGGRSGGGHGGGGHGGGGGSF